MKKIFLGCVILLFALGISASIFAGGRQDIEDNIGETNAKPGVLVVELIYLNHGPVRNVVTDIDNLLEGYGEQIHITRYSFGSSEGKSFAELRKLDGHIPLAVFINGSMKFKVDNRSVDFISFPQGGGTGFVADGEWSMDDLKQVIDGELVKS